MTLSRLESLIRADTEAMAALAAVRDVGPRGAFIAAGFVRNRYWDSLYSPKPEPVATDTDVVYFNADYSQKTRDLAFEASLRIVLPNVDWQVRNQARMHRFGGHAPFKGLEHALGHWAETATGIGVRLTEHDGLEWISAFGFSDLFDHILRITPAMKRNDPKGFDRRLQEKGWLHRWPDLQVVNT